MTHILKMDDDDGPKDKRKKSSRNRRDEGFVFRAAALRLQASPFL